MVFVPDNNALSLNKPCLLYQLLKRARNIPLSGRPRERSGKRHLLSVFIPLKSEERTNAA